MHKPVSTLSLSLANASILERIKETYLLWMTIVPHIAKGARHTLGARIEKKFLDLLELTYIAYFIPKERKTEKIEKITGCILISDILKFFISLTWESKLISTKQYEDVALKLNDVGRMLGGWKSSIENQEKKNRVL